MHVLAGVERRLTAGEALHFGLDRFLIEKLAAGQPVDVGAERGDAIFIGVLHPRLARDRCREKVVAENEIAGGGEIERAER